MKYTEAVRFVHSRLRFGSRLGLDNIKRITSLCGNPQKGMRFIHVAGTNGKGSISTMMSNVLISAGYRTGLYISPFVTDFRERFQIDGEMISKREFASIMGKIKPIIDELDSKGEYITEFEIITTAAFMWFKQRQCDYVVLEVGLGGRFDATNVIDSPECAVIAHIDYDHMKYLGDSIDKISFEKCGIIKPGCKVVAYPDQHEAAMRVIENTCKERGCSLTVPKVPDSQNSISGNRFEYDGEDYTQRLIGKHQVLNAVTVIEAAKAIGIDSRFIREGVSVTSFPARLEVMSDDPLVILDGAHNPDGMSALANAVKMLCTRKPTAIIGMLADKDYDKALGTVAPLFQHIVAVRVPNPRTLKASELAQALKQHCSDVVTERSYDGAIKTAVEKSDGAPIIICGSLYLASGIRPHILKNL